MMRSRKEPRTIPHHKSLWAPSWFGSLAKRDELDRSEGITNMSVAMTENY
jgi:hypothetical protein